MGRPFWFMKTTARSSLLFCALMEVVARAGATTRLSASATSLRVESGHMYLSATGTQPHIRAHKKNASHITDIKQSVTERPQEVKCMVKMQNIEQTE
jgi:hypothetical protein